MTRTKWISAVLATFAVLLGIGAALRVVHGRAPVLFAGALLAVAVATWPSSQLRVRLPSRSDSR